MRSNDRDGGSTFSEAPATFATLFEFVLRLHQPALRPLRKGTITSVRRAAAIEELCQGDFDVVAHGKEAVFVFRRLLVECSHVLRDAERKGRSR